MKAGLVEHGQHARQRTQRVGPQEGPAEPGALAGQEGGSGDGHHHAEQHEHQQVDAVEALRPPQNVDGALAPAAAGRLAGENAAEGEARQENKLLGTVRQAPGAVNQPAADKTADGVAGENRQLQPATHDVEPFVAGRPGRHLARGAPCRGAAHICRPGTAGLDPALAPRTRETPACP